MIKARPESIDRGITHIRDTVLPLLQETDGCIGLSLLVDRESGRCIATSAWQSREAMTASADGLRPVREQAGEILGGTPQVDEWEFVALHRDHTSRDGACVRVTWVRTEPSRIDRAIDAYKMAVLPEMQALEGFCSASLMVDRASGRLVGSVTFDGREAMERTRDQVAAVRERATQEAGAEVVEVGEFELALAHLRVPETA